MGIDVPPQAELFESFDADVDEAGRNGLRLGLLPHIGSSIKNHHNKNNSGTDSSHDISN